MFTALVLTLREAVEAALIIGILISLVNKTRPKYGSVLVYGGAAVAVGISVAVARLFGDVYRNFGPAVEGLNGLLAAGLLTYMVFWMGEQARDLQTKLRERAGAVLSGGYAWGLGVLAFLSVLREGIETVLFLISAGKTAPSAQVFASASAGVLLAVLLAILVFRGLVRVNLDRFFTWTAYLLIMFGAGILGRATAELQAAGWLPGTISAWNTGGFLPETSPLGALLSGILGYSANPSLLQLYVYLGYLVTALIIFTGSVRPEHVEVLEYGDPFRSVGEDYRHPLYRFLRRDWMPRLPMLVFTVIFAVLLAVGFWNIPVGPFSGQGVLQWGRFTGKAENNLFIFLIWIIWLPLISVSTVILGRFWCGNLCPLRLLTEAAATVGEKLRARPSPANPYLRAGWILPTSFVLITLLVRVYDFQSRARDGVYLFLGIVLAALVIGLLFRKGTWCRYVCPVGGWLARIARLSILSVRPRRLSCEKCVGHPCVRGRTLPAKGDAWREGAASRLGSAETPIVQAERCPVFLAPNRLESSQHCLLCWNCVKNCPEELSGMRLGLRFPGAELFKPYAPNLGESLYIAALLGLYMAVVMQGLLWPRLPFLVTLALLMGGTTAVYCGLSYMVSVLARIPLRESLTTIGYSFLPMEFATAIITMGDDSLEFFNIVVPGAAVLLGIGFVWSLVLGTSILLHRAPDKRRAMAGFLPVAAGLFVLLLFWATRFLSGQVIDLT